ncbi:MAG: AbrB/MazE/SpoVT family DNA-binding domain-containing protein [Patescibacteria group bacterium]|nr:AbrB/MazE/SpoVT family DNA-binding domain-containing protein [Patescibacteria group bacterium]
MLEEPEITTMSEKGQVVIPQDIRRHLGIKPKTRFIVFAINGNIVMRKLDIPDVKKEWSNIFQKMDKKGLDRDESDVASEIKAHRKSKHKKATD